MKKTIIAFLSLALITISAYAEGPTAQRCDLTEANAPEVRGIRLGMGVDPLVALFPGSSRRRDIKDNVDRAKAGDNADMVYLVFDPTADGAKDRFPGVETVAAAISKGKVVEFTVSYLGGSMTLDEWVKRVSESLKLPSQNWVPGPSENPNKVLRCSGIEIEIASSGGGGTLRMRSTR